MLQPFLNFPICRRVRSSVTRWHECAPDRRTRGGSRSYSHNSSCGGLSCSCQPLPAAPDLFTQDLATRAFHRTIHSKFTGSYLISSAQDFKFLSTTARKTFLKNSSFTWRIVAHFCRRKMGILKADLHIPERLYLISKGAELCAILRASQRDLL